MLIERDGSDTPPSRFSFPANQPTQHNPVRQNSCGTVWRNGPLLPVFSSKRRRSFFMPQQRPGTCGEIRTVYAIRAAKGGADDFLDRAYAYPSFLRYSIGLSHSRDFLMRPSR